MVAVLEIVSILEKTPITKEALEVIFLLYKMRVIYILIYVYVQKSHSKLCIIMLLIFSQKNKIAAII